MATINNNVRRLTVRLAKEFLSSGEELSSTPLEEMTFFGARFGEVLESEGVDTSSMTFFGLVEAVAELDEIKVGAKRGRKPKSETVLEDETVSA